MTRRDSGPPDRDEGPATPDQADTLTKPNNKPKTTARPARCAGGTVGRYTTGWKDGFTAGAVDALRRAGRWLPGDPDTWPEIWAALDALADAYQLAGGDVADGLIAEQRVVSRRLAGRDD